MEFISTDSHFKSMAEVSIGKLVKRLVTLIQTDDQKNWVPALRWAVFGLNLTPGPVDGLSPYELFFGHKPNCGLDPIVNEVRDDIDVSRYHSEYWQSLQERFRVLKETIIEQRTLLRKKAALQQRNRSQNQDQLVEGRIVYCVATNKAKTGLFTGSRHLNFSRIGPLTVARKCQDEYVFLSTLDNKLISTPIHIHRVSVAKIKIENQFVSTVQELLTALRGLPEHKKEELSREIEIIADLVTTLNGANSDA